MTARVAVRRIFPRPFIPMTAADFERFDALTVAEPNTGCVLWLGNVGRKGYGVFRVGSTLGVAHRLAFQRAYGSIPHLMCACHRCDTPACVNPDHLFLGTIADNNHDMARKGRARGPAADKRRRKIVCKRGHPMAGANLRIITKANGQTTHECRECSRARAREKDRIEGAKRRAERVSQPRLCKRGHVIAGDNIEPAKDGYLRCLECRRRDARDVYRARFPLGSWPRNRGNRPQSVSVIPNSPVIFTTLTGQNTSGDA